jgi:hypothetical protein
MRLRETVEVKLDDATAAKSIGSFYGAMYSSMPFAYGAKRDFGFLSRSTIGDEAANEVVPLAITDIGDDKNIPRSYLRRAYEGHP